MSKDKEVNYHEDIQQKDLPKKLKKDFGISEQLTMGLVESYKVEKESYPKKEAKGLKISVNKDGDAKGLVDGDGDTISSKHYVRVNDDDETFDVILRRFETNAKAGEDWFRVRGWKKPD